MKSNIGRRVRLIGDYGKHYKDMTYVMEGEVVENDGHSSWFHVRLDDGGYSFPYKPDSDTPECEYIDEEKDEETAAREWIQSTTELLQEANTLIELVYNHLQKGENTPQTIRDEVSEYMLKYKIL